MDVNKVNRQRHIDQLSISLHMYAVKCFVYIDKLRLTLPSSSIPRLLKRVPALLQDRRDIKVNVEASPDFVFRIGVEDRGIVIVSTNPRIAEVRIRDASSASRSREASWERKFTNGLIIYPFHKKESSKLSIENSAASAGLYFGQQPPLHIFDLSYRSCSLFVRSKSVL